MSQRLLERILLINQSHEGSTGFTVICPGPLLSSIEG